MYCYILQAGNWFKIGKSDNPKKRIKQMQTGCPYDISLILTIKEDSLYSSYEIERAIHDKFSNKRGRGEWFILSVDDISIIYSMFNCKRYAVPKINEDDNFRKVESLLIELSLVNEKLELLSNTSSMLMSPAEVVYEIKTAYNKGKRELMEMIKTFPIDGKYFLDSDSFAAQWYADFREKRIEDYLKKEKL